MIETRQGERGETGRQYLQTSEEEDKLLFGWKCKRASDIVMSFQHGSLIFSNFFFLTEAALKDLRAWHLGERLWCSLPHLRLRGLLSACKLVTCMWDWAACASYHAVRELGKTCGSKSSRTVFVHDCMYVRSCQKPGMVT
jgi:hypothetical protein